MLLMIAMIARHRVLFAITAAPRRGHNTSAVLKWGMIKITRLREEGVFQKSLVAGDAEKPPDAVGSENGDDIVLKQCGGQRPWYLPYDIN
jgi:hypothetical protein